MTFKGEKIRNTILKLSFQDTMEEFTLITITLRKYCMSQLLMKND